MWTTPFDFKRPSSCRSRQSLRYEQKSFHNWILFLVASARSQHYKIHFVLCKSRCNTLKKVMPLLCFWFKVKQCTVKVSNFKSWKFWTKNFLNRIDSRYNKMMNRYVEEVLVGNCYSLERWGILFYLFKAKGDLTLEDDLKYHISQVDNILFLKAVLQLSISISLNINRVFRNRWLQHHFNACGGKFVCFRATWVKPRMLLLTKIKNTLQCIGFLVWLGR